MAALYQIAQSDPPSLDKENQWNEKLIALVTAMLKKGYYSIDQRETVLMFLVRYLVSETN